MTDIQSKQAIAVALRTSTSGLQLRGNPNRREQMRDFRDLDVILRLVIKNS